MAEGRAKCSNHQLPVLSSHLPRYLKMQTASVVPHSQLIEVQTWQPATHALLLPSPTFPDLSLTIALPAYASPCSFTILELGPQYPLLPQSECCPSNQRYPNYHLHKSSCKWGPAQIPPLPWSLLSSPNWIRCHKSLYQTQSTLRALSIFRFVTLLTNLKSWEAPGSCHRGIPQPCPSGSEEQDSTKSQARHFLGLSLQKKRYFKLLLIYGPGEQCGFKNT